MGVNISRRDFIKVAGATGAAGLGGLLLGCNLFAGRSREAFGAIKADGPFTVVALPDTQFYSKDYPGIFAAQTQWIVDNKDRLNIVFVVHLGDVVDAGYDPAQGGNARAAMDRLDGVVPFGLVPGNHDLYLSQVEDSPNPTFVEWFGPNSRYFAGKKWYGGASPSGFSSWQKIATGAGGQELIFLNLDDGAKGEEIAWGQQVIDRNPGTPTILVTHEYLNEHATRHTRPYLQEPGRQAGQQMWDRLVRGNSQIFMVLCGHTHGQARRISWNDAGQPVHELLSDYQMLANGGNGFMRVMTFDPRSARVEVRTWSPTLRRNLRESDTPGEGTFAVTVDFAARFAPSAPGRAVYAVQAAPGPGTKPALANV